MSIRIFGYYYNEFVECRKLLRKEKVNLENYIFVISLNQLTCLDYTKVDSEIFEILYSTVTSILGMSVYMERHYIRGEQ